MTRILMAAAVAVLPLSARAQEAPTNLNEATVAQLQSMMASGQLTSVALTNFYIKRILALDQNGPGVNAVIELNPDALAIAKNADTLRASGKVLGPLHGIPVLLKDNIDTGDKMQTSAGSFALVGQPAVRDSTVAPPMPMALWASSPRSASPVARAWSRFPIRRTRSARTGGQSPTRPRR